jgi:hypothetical protein
VLFRTDVHLRGHIGFPDSHPRRQQVAASQHQHRTFTCHGRKGKGKGRQARIENYYSRTRTAVLENSLLLLLLAMAGAAWWRGTTSRARLTGIGPYLARGPLCGFAEAVPAGANKPPCVGCSACFGCRLRQPTCAGRDEGSPTPPPRTTRGIRASATHTIVPHDGSRPKPRRGTVPRPAEGLSTTVTIARLGHRADEHPPSRGELRRAG